MASYIINSDTLEAIASALRRKLHIADPITAAEFATRILSIPALTDYYLTIFARDMVSGSADIKKLSVSKITDGEDIGASVHVPISQGIIESIHGVALRGFSAKPSIITDKVPLLKLKEIQYIVDTTKQREYDFDKRYVLYDTEYALKTKYGYTSEEREIDNGSLCSTTVITENLAELKNMEVTLNE